ncbi:MAG: glutathione peroxidase [Pseudomonadota bacterium]
MRPTFFILTALVMCACSDATVANMDTDEAKDGRANTSVQELGMAHETSFTTIDGKPLPFSTFAGEVVLVVNTASHCGYTGQYAGLQELYTTFKDQGFTVLGVPSNDFGAQEPGTEKQISSFCEINYGVEFPLTRKTKVVGEDQHELWQMAKASLGDKAEPKWNFHKVLVGRDGSFLQAYPSGVRPADTELVADIERALNETS